LRATKTGSKVFAVMKGAADGGLHIPHSEKRLPGKAEESGENKILRKRIFGGHIDDYMALLKGNDKGNLQFS
jgi:large subunit ribosomal protein L5e